jgi:hypothetical protein
MTAKIIPFPPRATLVQSTDSADDAIHSPAQLHAAIEQLEQLDHDLQVQAHKINLSLGEIRRKRQLLLKRVAALRSA